MRGPLLGCYLDLNQALFSPDSEFDCLRSAD